MRRITEEISVARETFAATKRMFEQGFTRDAASRVYYVMFHAASALLLSEGKEFKSHKETIGAFGKLFARTGRIDPKFHRYLIDAEDLRALADYGTHVPITERKVSETIRNAEEFLAMAEKFIEGAGGERE